MESWVLQNFRFDFIRFRIRIRLDDPGGYLRPRSIRNPLHNGFEMLRQRFRTCSTSFGRILMPPLLMMSPSRPVRKR